MKKIGIVSDIHGNLAALEVALRFLDDEGVGDVICCGDVVGYGPCPNECVALIKDRCGCCISGNHDASAVDRIALSHFGGNAGIALRWTQTQLSHPSKTFLRSRAEKTTYQHFTVTHGSVRDPIWEYIDDRRTAYANFRHFEERICWFGHSHLPTLYIENGGDVQGGFLGAGAVVSLSPQERYLINPGSVGQPRDGDWRLALAVYAVENGNERVAFHRLEYDVARTQQQMKAANLPAHLYNRLELGR